MRMGRGERTKAEIIAVGLRVWREQPEKVNSSHIASLVGITHAAVLYHFDSVEFLRNAIAEYAVRVADPVVVPMLIAARHPAIAGLSDGQKQQFLAAL